MSFFFGATGFTGNIAAEYLATNYGSKVKWGIAGRNESQLKAIRQQLMAIDSSLEKLPIFICDSSKHESLLQVVSNTRVIISTVGPFTLYGSPLVSLCAQLGTSYCDVTGELDWVRKMIFQYHAIAQKSGARIIHLAGHDCIPWDLSTLALSNKLKSKGETLQEIRHYDYSRLIPSGGTLATVLLLFLDKSRKNHSHDPLLHTDENGKTEFRTIIQRVNFPTWSSDIQRWIGPSLMAIANANCVRRSNSILGYSKRLVYYEVDVYASFFAAVNIFLVLMFGVIGLIIPPLRWVIERWVFPKGTGPSKAMMDKGFLKVDSIGKSDKGTIITSTLYYPTDAGYRDTGRMIVETALAMVLDRDKLTIGGGVWTPACLGETLLKRLINTGCTFNFHDQSSWS